MTFDVPSEICINWVRTILVKTILEFYGIHAQEHSALVHSIGNWQKDEIWRGTLQAKVRVALVHRLQFGPALQQRGTRSKAPKIRIAIIALQQRGTKIGLLPSGIAAYT